MPDKILNKGYWLVLLTIALSFVQGGRTIKDFRLKNVDGTMVSLSSYPNAKGFIIIFTCNHCPFARLYPARLNALNNRYLPQHIPLLAINSVDTTVFDEDRFAQMVTTAKQNDAHYAYLYDASQQVAAQFGADKTPHAFVIWKENGQWVIKYDGAIDDNGAEPDKVSHRYIQEAIESLLKGERVAISRTKCIGCKIKLRS